MTGPHQQKDIVLIVDDEQIILRSASMTVSKLGFRVLVAENGAAGLETFMAAREEICLVLSDVVMPFMSGIEMAERMLELAPQAKILLMSGYSDEVIRPKGTDGLTLMKKPFLPADLGRAIQSALAARA